MKYSKLIVASSVIAILGFSACGGGGGGSSSPTSSVDTKTGVFLDSAVEGLSYSCVSSGLSGKTNAKGEYNYKDGDTCTFSIGSMEIGSARAKGIMTPLDIIKFYDGEKNKFYNVLRVLQTLDQDGNVSNGIVLPDNLDGNITGGFNVVESSFDTAFQGFLDTNEINSSIVSQRDASQHFGQTLSSEFDANLTDAMFEEKMIKVNDIQVIFKTDKTVEIFSTLEDAPCNGSWSLSDEKTLKVSAESCGLFRQTLLQSPEEHKFMFANTPAQDVSVAHIYDSVTSLHEVDFFGDATAPNAATDITYSNVNQSSFTINWKNTSENETVNRVACYENADDQTQPNFQFFPGSNETEFSATYDELDANTLYGCRVDTSNLAGSVSSTIVNVTTATVGSGGNNSNDTLDSIDVRELTGHTIVTTSLKNSIKEIAYIFEANGAVQMVFNRRDGGQFVKAGTYELSDVTNQLIATLEFDPSTILDYTLFYENHLIYPKEYISLSMTVTKIATNTENGIIIQNDQPLATSDALTVTSIDDLKGYTITSNLSDRQDSTSVVINCDGSSDTTYSVVIGGQTYTSTEHDNLIEMRPEELIYTQVDVGEYWLLLSSTNQLVEDKTCIMSLNDDGTCSDNWKIQTIEQTTQCQ